MQYSFKTAYLIKTEKEKNSNSTWVGMGMVLYQSSPLRA